MRQVKFGAIVLALVGSAAMAQSQRGAQERVDGERGPVVRERAPAVQRGADVQRGANAQRGADGQRGLGDADRREQFMQRRAQIMQRMQEHRAERGESRQGAAARPGGERRGEGRLQERAGDARGPVRPGGAERAAACRGNAGRLGRDGRGGDQAGSLPGQGRGFEGGRDQEFRPQQGQRPQAGHQQGEGAEGQRPQVQRFQRQRFQGQGFQGQGFQGQGLRGERFQGQRLDEDGPAQRFRGGQTERQLERPGQRRGPGAQDDRGAGPGDRAAVRRRLEQGSNGRL
ncbi:MAG: hypothetical protein HND58_07285 [Planctomycetota bacterium]|nr:MAG: hypothetical protein HND58_07285 [Planctomycetota bacterium]